MCLGVSTETRKLNNDGTHLLHLIQQELAVLGFGVVGVIAKVTLIYDCLFQKGLPIGGMLVAVAEPGPYQRQAQRSPEERTVVLTLLPNGWNR